MEMHIPTFNGKVNLIVKHYGTHDSGIPPAILFYYVDEQGNSHELRFDREQLRSWAAGLAAALRT